MSMQSELERVRAIREMLTPESPIELRLVLEEQTLCPRCLVPVGEPHLPDCTIARCLMTGLQRFQCDENHDCGQQVWAGVFPGMADAIALGLWARLEPGTGWVPATPDDEGAIPDLNTLMSRCHWDANSQRWIDEPSHAQ
jgi:hypothetical protein